MRVHVRLSSVGLVCGLIACSSGPRRPVRDQSDRARDRSNGARVAAPRRPAPPGPLSTPRVYEDRARLAALRTEMTRSSDPHAALTLGRLLHLAGKAKEARQAWARARALLQKQGKGIRPMVVTPGGVSALAWRGSTLALTRALHPATRDYRGGWSWLELWDRVGDTFPAARLRLGPAGGSGGIVWAGARKLWWHGGRALLLLDTRSGRTVRRISTGKKPVPYHRRYARLIAAAATSGHLAAVIGPQIVRVWDARGAKVRDVVLKGTTRQMIRANMGTHCVMRSIKIPVKASLLALSAGGRRLAVAANDGKVRLVEVRTGRTRVLKQKWRRMFYAFPRNPFNRGRVLRMWFSGSGKRLGLLQADSSLFTWDTRTGKQRKRWQPSCGPKSKPSARRKPGRSSGLVTPRLRRRWGRERCTNVWGADLATGGKLLATVRGSVRLRRLPKGTRLPDLKVKRANGLRFDAKGGLLAVSKYYRGAEVWRVSPSKRLASLARPTVEGQIADLSPDGRYLAVWEGKETWSLVRRVSVWDLTRRHRLGRLTVWGPRAVRFTSDSRVLVAGVGGAVELWRLADWKRVRRLGGVAFAKTKRRLTTAGALVIVTGYADKRFRVWHRRTGVARDFPEPARPKGVVLSPDGSRLALLSEKHVDLWAVAAGRKLRTLPVKRPKAVAWSRSGHLVALVGRTHKEVRVIDVATGAVRARLPVKYTPDALLFGPRDKELMIGGIGVFGRWSWRSSPKLVVLKNKNRHLSPKGFRFGPGDKRLVVFGFYHRAVSIWDPAAGKLLADLWPVQGGHWVAISAAGAVDATVLGRETVVTLVPPTPSPAVKSPRSRREAVYGWGVGWACFVKPGLVAAAVLGRSLKPTVKPSCRVAP